MSTPEVSENGTYTLTAGSYSETIEVSDGMYSNISGGMHGGMGGHGGGMNGGPGQDMQQPEEMSL